MRKLFLLAIASTFMACQQTETVNPEDALIGTHYVRESETYIYIQNGVEVSRQSSFDDRKCTITESGRTENEYLYSSNKRVYLKNGVISGEHGKRQVVGAYKIDGKKLHMDFEQIPEQTTNTMFIRWASDVQLQ